MTDDELSFFYLWLHGKKQPKDIWYDYDLDVKKIKEYLQTGKTDEEEIQSMFDTLGPNIRRMLLDNFLKFSVTLFKVDFAKFSPYYDKETLTKIILHNPLSVFEFVDLSETPFTRLEWAKAILNQTEKTLLTTVLRASK